MPFKDPLKRIKYAIQYNKKYYADNRQDLLEYRKTRKDEDREAWRRWYLKKKDEKRKAAIKTNTVYRNRKNLVTS